MQSVGWMRDCLLSLGLLAVVVQAETADFLILTDPAALTVLNRYEQSLTKEELRLFVPGIPLQIVAEDQLLGDQITPAMKVRFGRQDFFLQKNDDGSLIGVRAGAGPQRVRRCEVLQDTVLVSRRSGIVLRMGESPSSASRGTAAKGDRLLRVFRSGGQFYVERIGLRPAFGWCNPGASDIAVPHTQTAATAQDTVLPDRVRDRVIERLTSANNAYRALFEYLNRSLNQSRGVPAWTWTASSTEIRCTISGFRNVESMLARSTESLSRDIENIVAGYGFGVRMHSGGMTVCRLPSQSQ